MLTHFVLFFLNTLLVFVINFLLFFCFAKKACRRSSVLSAFIITASQILFVVWVSGWVFESLYPHTLTITNIISSYLLCKYLGVGFDDIKKAAIKAKEVFLHNSKATPPLLKVFLLFVCVQFLWLLLIGYLYPPYSSDAIVYHMPIASYFLQAKAIYYHVQTSVRWIKFYPKNLEMFFLWELVFLKSDILVNCTQVLFMFFACLALINISINLGVDRNISTFCGFMFVCFPLVIQQSTLAMVDVALASLFFITLNFFLDYTVNGETYSLCLGGASGGIMLGVKVTGILLLGTSLLFLFMSLFLLKKTIGKEKVIKLMLPIFLLGGFWYFQNWVIMGNPVYPIPINYAGYKIFEGKVRSIHYISERDIPASFKALSPLERMWKSWRESNFVRYSYYYKSGGFGALFFIFFLPNLFYATFISILRRRWNFLLLVTPFLLSFTMLSLNWYSRHNIQLLGLFSVSTAVTLSSIPFRKFLIYAMSAIGLYNVIIGNLGEMTSPGKVISLLELPAEQRTPTHILKLKNRYSWIAENIKAKDVLGFSQKAPLMSYLLWNKSLSNSIHCIFFKNEREWRQKVKKLGIDYYLVKKGQKEEAWTKGYKVLYEDKEYRVMYIS